MTYDPQTWIDGVAGDTPITAERLANMELGIEANSVAIDALDDEQGVGKMMHAFVPNGHYWILATEVIDGWDAPTFMTVDGVGCYVVAPFTGEAVAMAAPLVNTWQLNTTGSAVHLSVMSAIVGTKGQNGHMYLITSSDGMPATYRRHDFLALRTGGATP